MRLFQTASDMEEICYTSRMAEIQFNPTVRWQWLPFGYSASYTQTSKIKEKSQLKALLDLIINKILPPECLTHREVIDIGPSESHEILVIRGETQKQGEESTEDEAEWIPFSIQLMAKFKEFRGSHHIVYALTWQKSDEISPELSVREVVINDQFQLRHISVDLAFFGSRFTSIFGFSPVATRHLSLIADETALKWEIVVEGEKTRKTAVGTFNTLSAPLSTLDTLSG